MAAAAVLLIAATFAFLRVSGQSDPLVAAELARDHSACFALAGDDGPAADLAYLEQSFERSFGWDPGIPVGLQTQGVELLEARRCAYHDGQMAHVLCRLDGQPMSLFVLPQGARPNEDLEIVGQRVIMWGTGDRTYALVGQQAGPALQPCRLVHSHTIGHRAVAWMPGSRNSATVGHISCLNPGRLSEEGDPNDEADATMDDSRWGGAGIGGVHDSVRDRHLPRCPAVGLA